MALGLCLTLGLWAPAAEATNVGTSLTVGIQSTKTTAISPLHPLERDMMSIYGLVYEGLVTIDDDYLPAPGLAESWEVSNGGKTWTFKLRENVCFSDGTVLTANDVVATAQYILDRAADELADDKGYYRNLQYFVKSISAPDEQTVVVKSSRGYWALPYAMTFPVLPAGWVQADNPPGTGPYVIDSFSPGDYLYLSANPLWWQKPPKVQEISVICHTNDKDVIESYEYARVDTIFTRSIAAAQHKSGTASLALDYRTNQLETLQMNNSSWELTENVRKAIRYVVNPDKIASNVYMGMVKRTDTPMISGTWMYNPAISFQQDLDKARELLEADGWYDMDGDGVLNKTNDEGEVRKLHLSFYVYEEPDNDVRVEAANMIADQLAQVGFEIKVSTVTLTEMSERLNSGSYDLALVSYAMDVCPDPGFMLMRGNTGNYSRYRSETMTELCESLRKQTTQEGFRDVLFQIQQQFADDCPFLCLYYRAGAVLTRKMYTTARDVRELDLLRGLALFHEE